MEEGGLVTGDSRAPILSHSMYENLIWYGGRGDESVFPCSLSEVRKCFVYFGLPRKLNSLSVLMIDAFVCSTTFLCPNNRQGEAFFATSYFTFGCSNKMNCRLKMRFRKNSDEVNSVGFEVHDFHVKLKGDPLTVNCVSLVSLALPVLIYEALRKAPQILN